MSRHRLVNRQPMACTLLVAGLLLAEAAGAQPDPAGHVTAIRLTAQPTAGTLDAEYRPVRLWPVGAAVQAIRAALDKPCGRLEFAETPLRDVVAMIAEQGGIPIALDHKAFEDAGLDADTPVTGRFVDVPLRSALRAVLHDLDLATIIRHDRLLATTSAAAHEHPVRTFYPIVPGEDLEEVVALIERTIAPQTWDTVGGQGTVAAAPASLGWGLVVAHDEDVQDQVEALLRECDRMAWQAPGPADGRAKHLRAYEIDDDVTRVQLAEELVALCNQALPEGGDPDARVLEIGRSLVVQSRSRQFHLMAAQLIAAVTGVVQLMEVEVELPAEDDPEQAERPKST